MEILIYINGINFISGKSVLLKWVLNYKEDL